jgi:hypothetical protein
MDIGPILQIGGGWENAGTRAGGPASRLGFFPEKGECLGRGAGSSPGANYPSAETEIIVVAWSAEVAWRKRIRLSHLKEVVTNPYAEAQLPS